MLHGRALLTIAFNALATAQQYEWRRATEPAPTAGGAGQLAYDTARKRMVCLLGVNTLVGDGGAWRMRGTLPMAWLQQARLAHHGASGRTVLFGGFSSGGYSAQTWLFAGGTWTQLVTATNPPGRWQTRLAYDGARQRIVMFGGEAQSGSLSDTWEFDGANWIQQFPGNTPNTRSRNGLCYDAARGVTVLFGGNTASATVLLAETWEWDGTNWTQRFPVQSPPARHNHGMAYDPARARTVAFGGILAGSVNVADTWEYDGATWTQVAIGLPAPPNQASLSLACDPDRGEIVSVEGEGGSMRTWAFDGAGWRIVIPSPSPDTRDQHAMAYDRVRGETLLFGQAPLFGYPGYAVTTWTNRGGAWVQHFPATSPPFTALPALAHDPAGGGVLMFGGVAAGLQSGITWRWNGVDWQSVPASPSPPPRSAAAMAADLGRGRVVLFGGEGLGGVLRNDTWEWNGASWLQRLPAQSPPAREGHAMGYDPLRARTVLFGGGDLLFPPTLGDHWEWDGTNWMQVTVPLPPSRSAHSLVFDRASQKMLMLGGQFLVVSALSAPRNDLWEWDGAVWTQRPAIVPAPPSRRQTTAAHDDGLGRTLLFGGDLDVDAWLLGPQSAAAVVEYGTGCSGTFGLPEVRNVGQPFVGNPWFAVQASALVPGAIALLGVSAAQANVPLQGGCTALVAQPIWFAGVAGARGTVEVPLPIPNLASLRGVDAFAQWVAVDAQGAFGNLVALSAGLRVRLD